MLKINHLHSGKIVYILLPIKSQRLETPNMAIKCNHSLYLCVYRMGFACVYAVHIYVYGNLIPGLFLFK